MVQGPRSVVGPEVGLRLRGGFLVVGEVVKREATSSLMMFMIGLGGVG